MQKLGLSNRWHMAVGVCVVSGLSLIKYLVGASNVQIRAATAVKLLGAMNAQSSVEQGEHAGLFSGGA